MNYALIIAVGCFGALLGGIVGVLVSFLFDRESATKQKENLIHLHLAERAKTLSLIAEAMQRKQDG